MPADDCNGHPGDQQLPAGIGSVSVTSSQAVSLIMGYNRLQPGNLTNGGAATINVIVEPLTPGSYTNSASVWSSAADSNLTNNGSSTVAAVVAGSSLSAGQRW